MENDQSNPTGEDPRGAEPTEQVDRQAMPVDQEEPPKLAFPVVGIGASAGGLPAMTEFITAMRSDSGMAFVFIQHLPPDRESLIADILTKKTDMLVQQVEDGMEVKPDHVYVIRPGHILTIKDGRFHLGEQVGKRGTTRPIDDFFKSLAEEQRERAIAVVMSGMGSNGTAGAQAIKAVGGLCVAQEPDSAEFPSMPRHLIDQGYADYVLRPSDMPAMLSQYAEHPYAREGRQGTDAQLGRQYNHVREVLAILRTRTRQDFNGYKKPTILRRIQRRMGLMRTTDMADYSRLLRQSPSEVRALSDDLLIHVTGFFRDPEAWDALRERVIVPLIARREPDSEIRAWVTGCSSGEEAYTLAILLAEEAERAGKPLGIKVFATDMAERALSHARQGIYPGGIESEIEPERLEKFFEREDATYRIKPFLRECVMFAPQNVLSDPPFSRLDIVTCRNLLIYLEPDMQRRVLSLLHFGLSDGGALFLGSSESVAGVEDMYEVVDKRARIFRRIGPTRHGLLDFPLPHAMRGRMIATGEGEEAGGTGAATGLHALDLRGTRVPGRASIGLLTQRTLLEQHVQAAVTVDRDNRVLYYHGNTRPFLDQPPGEPTRDLMMLCREGLRGSVRVALHRCAAEQQAVTVMDGWVEITPGRQARVAVTASPVSENDPTQPEYFVVSFDHLDELHRSPSESAEPGEGNGDEAAGELRRVRDELQTTIEELQTSNEELKASHEEVTSINEELQSSNEELETSKEEMQSLNEELTTLNAQLTAKIEEHQQASNDMSALLSSTAIAVLFLDADLRIRRYTPAMRELMDLIPTDVGRPLMDLNRKFDDPRLEEDARTVLEKLVPVEREVPAGNGRHYARRVLPYRTVDNRIDGVVVTFFDVTDRKQAELEVVAAREYSESIVETLHEPLLVLKSDLTVRTANSAFYRHFKVKEAETVGRKIYALGNGQWDIPELRTALEAVLPKKKVFDDYEVTHTFENVGRRVMLLNGRQLDHVQLILLGIRDVTAQYDVEAAARAGETQFKLLVQNLHDYAILMTDPKGVITQWTEGAVQVTGYSAQEAIGKHISIIYTPEQVAEGHVEQELTEAANTSRAEREDWRMRKNGERFWANEVVNPIRSPDGQLTAFAKITRDLGERRWAQQALRESEERFRLIVETVRDYAIFTTDPEANITSWNPGAERIFRYATEEIIGKNARMLFTPEDQANGEHAKELETAARDGRASDDRWQMRNGGERFWAGGVTSALRDAAGNLIGFTKILRDETARKQLEEDLRTANEVLEQRVSERTRSLGAHQSQLRSLVAELGRSEIRQRRMLATELHDNLAQLLAVCKMRVSAIEAQSPEQSSARQEAAAVKESLGEAIGYTRTLMSDLRPDVLDEHDLKAAMEWIAQRMLKYGLKVVVHDDDEPKPLSEDMLGLVFQSVRELLWNVVKHAKTSHAIIILERPDGEVQISVSDKGVGFDPAARKSSPGDGGFGLFNIAERIDLSGGRMEIESARGKGTRVTLIIPIDGSHDGGDSSTST